MHENATILEASPRERLGSRYSRRLRTLGRLPAIVYGHKIEPTPISLDRTDACLHIEAGEKVFRIAIDGAAEPQVVLLKEIQFDYLGSNIVHADFARVDLNERVHTRVHIDLIGEAVGLKEIGAILMRPHNEIEIECRVADIPDSIEADISSLELNQTLTAAQIALPVDDMKLLGDAGTAIAQIVLQAAAKSAEAEEVEVEGEPEVLGDADEKTEETKEEKSE